MPSARSSAMRSTPGYVVRPTVSAPAPVFSLPQIPNVPQIDDARAPRAYLRDHIARNVLPSLAGRYAPAFTQSRENARARLAGYGGVTFRDDDPNTPEREDLSVNFDPNAPLGQREKNAVDTERDQANMRGLASSSFANRAIGGALTRMNEEKRAIVNQFSSEINAVIEAQATEATSHITDWMRLYGEDSRWLVDNPPPAPPDLSVAPDGRRAPAPGYTYDPASGGFRPPPTPEGGFQFIRPSGFDLSTPSARTAWERRNPGYTLKKAGPENGGGWVGVRNAPVAPPAAPRNYRLFDPRPAPSPAPRGRMFNPRSR